MARWLKAFQFSMSFEGLSSPGPYTAHKALALTADPNKVDPYAMKADSAMFHQRDLDAHFSNSETFSKVSKAPVQV